jgi:hypothetical protein
LTIASRATTTDTGYVNSALIPYHRFRPMSVHPDLGLQPIINAAGASTRVGAG